MANVSFDEESSYRTSTFAAKKSSGILGVFVRVGLARDTASAEKIAIFFIIVSVICAVGIFWYNQPPKAGPPLPVPGGGAAPAASS